MSKNYLILLFTSSVFLFLLVGCTGNSTTEDNSAPTKDVPVIENNKEETDVATPAPTSETTGPKEAQATSVAKGTGKANEEWTSKNMVFNPKYGKAFAEGFEPDAQSDAMEDVSVSKAGTCGLNGCGKVIFLNNLNGEKTILISVSTVWKDESGKKKELKNYTVSPGTSLPIGCSQFCKEEGAKVKWSIIGAKYID